MKKEKSNQPLSSILCFDSVLVLQLERCNHHFLKIMLTDFVKSIIIPCSSSQYIFIGERGGDACLKFLSYYFFRTYSERIWKLMLLNSVRLCVSKQSSMLFRFYIGISLVESRLTSQGDSDTEFTPYSITGAGMTACELCI